MAIGHNKSWVAGAATKDLWLAQNASHILFADLEGQQKFVNLEMKPQFAGLLQFVIDLNQLVIRIFL